MIQIMKPVSAAEKLCGVQKEAADREYRLTRHCVIVPCEDGDLYYHTLTGELLLADAPEGASDRQELLRKWFYVPDDFDECKYSDVVRKIVAMISQKPTVKNSFTIFSTSDCNARCFYCYEMGRNRVNMSEQTAHDVADYIAEACKGTKVRLRWFGGEPLYHIKPIDIITSELAGKGVEFESSMTSNGFYLTKEVAKKAVDHWNLKTVQITIDGTESVYNKTKSYIDPCENPFQRVLDHIEGALDSGIKVFIRLNVDQNNESDMLHAVDILGERFRGRENCKILVALLRSFAGSVHEFDSCDDEARCYLDLINRLDQYGLRRKKPLFRELAGNRCMADGDSSEVILPDGRLGKCEHFSETELIGSIYCPERDTAMIDAWKERCSLEDLPECAECPLYPRCINLKKCEWTNHGCPESVRRIRTEQLKDNILDIYHNWKQEHRIR